MYPEIERHRAELEKCVTCGICHPVCPTYLLSHRELLSPRGRIVLLRRLLAGDIQPAEISANAFDFCTLCYACQTVCPAGVRTDSLFIAARSDLAASNGIDKRKQQIFDLLEKPNRVNQVISLVSLAQKIVGRKIVEKLAGGMAVPELRTRPYLRELPSKYEAFGSCKLRVGLLLGCVSNYVDEHPARAVIEVLRRLGAEVVIPPGQMCCGAPAFNNGDFESARRLAKINLQIFSEADVDWIVSPDATCGGAFRHEIPMLLEDDDEFSELAVKIAEKTIDFASFVVDKLDPKFPESIHGPLNITIHDSCHLTHTQKAQGKVRELLSRLPGVKIVEMAESTLCCGFGGSFSVGYPEQAEKWSKRKIQNILDSKVSTAVVGSPGCIIQLKQIVDRDSRNRINLKHPAEVIAERCGWSF